MNYFATLVTCHIDATCMTCRREAIVMLPSDY